LTVGRLVQGGEFNLVRSTRSAKQDIEQKYDMINLEEQIKLLVELQGLDSHIFKLEDALCEIPETIKSMEDEFKEKSVGLKNLEDGVKALQVNRKENEVELETKEGVIKKYQSQLYQVKTNKEYTALQEEIGRVRADNSLIEEAIIKILDQIDDENKKIAQEKESLKQKEIKLNEEKKALKEEEARLKTELEDIGKKRAALVPAVDKGILAKYEKIVRNRDGLAVVAVRNDSCQGCFRVMPPQVINEMKMKKDIVMCDYCARILYIEE